MIINKVFKPRSWPISVKLSVTLLLTALLPMIFTAYYNLQGSVTSISETELRNLRQLSVATANRVDQLISDTRFLAKYLGTEKDIITLVSGHDRKVADSVQGKLQRLVFTDNKLELLLVMDKKGNVLSAPADKFIGRNYSYREYFQAAIQGRVYVSNITVGDVTRKPGLFFSSPVLGKSGKVEGVIVVKIAGSAVSNIIDEANTGKQTAYLIDSEGVLIHHPDSGLLYKSLTPLSERSIQKIVKSKRFLLDKIDSLGFDVLADSIVGAKNSGTVNYLSPISGEEEISGYAPVKSHRWVVGISIEQSSFAEPLNKQFNNVLYSVVGVGIIFTIIALLFSRSFIKPIHALMQAANRVRDGDYDDGEIKITSEDEFGELMRTFNLMVASVRERERERDIFGRVVSPEVREKLLMGDVKLGGENRQVSVLFSDIRGFSSMSEKMEPDEVVEFLNEYLTGMTEAVQEWGGYVNNFIGDAIVVIFGAPDSQDEMEFNAVSAALAMRKKLALINLKREQRGEPIVMSGIGISTGDVVAGQVGSLERFLYTVIGDAVNVAARLETLTKEYPDHNILINAETYSGVKEKDSFNFTHIGQQKVKGRTQNVDVYAVKEVE
ncbi:MAG: HAMP domain-containing protein [Sulfuriflexus sp.]|nr:HAMP domain-containing protein [Sulfuriflexus sp.]